MNFPDLEKLFEFLIDGLLKLALPAGKYFYVTAGENIVCLSSDKNNQDPKLDCTHKEANTRTFDHLSHVVRNGHT